MNDELKSLAVLTLRNAFYHDFSALVNVYLDAAKGLDVELLEMQLSEMTSIYSRDRTADDIVQLNIWSQNGESIHNSSGWDTMLEALEYPEAIAVHLCGKKVFVRVNDEWQVVEDIENS